MVQKAKRKVSGEQFSCWMGNPTMVWRAQSGFHTHMLMAGMVHPAHRGMSKEAIKKMAVEEAKEYAAKHRIKCFVLHCLGDTIIIS